MKKRTYGHHRLTRMATSETSTGVRTPVCPPLLSVWSPMPRRALRLGVFHILAKCGNFRRIRKSACRVPYTAAATALKRAPSKQTTTPWAIYRTPSHTLGCFNYQENTVSVSSSYCRYRMNGVPAVAAAYMCPANLAPPATSRTRTGAGHAVRGVTTTSTTNANTTTTTTDSTTATTSITEASKQVSLSPPCSNISLSKRETVTCIGTQGPLSPPERNSVGDIFQPDTSGSALQPYNDKQFFKERYGPPRDPSTLLIEPHRLTKEERFFQKLFIALPGVTFLMMLAAPVALVRYHVRKLQERAAYTEQVAEALTSDLWGPSFQECDFPALRNVIEQPTHAFVFYFHPDSIGSQVARPLLWDIGRLFEELRVRMRVVAVDLAEKSIPDAVRRMFPVALAPHGELLLPFAYHGQQPALQLYDGEWEAQSIVAAVAREVPAAVAAVDAAKELNAWTERLSECLFSLRFVDDRPDPGTAMGQQLHDIPMGSGAQNEPDTAAAEEAVGDRFVKERARAVGLTKGVQEALQECEAARDELRRMVQQQMRQRTQP